MTQPTSEPVTVDEWLQPSDAVEPPVTLGRWISLAMLGVVVSTAAVLVAGRLGLPEVPGAIAAIVASIVLAGWLVRARTAGRWVAAVAAVVVGQLVVGVVLFSVLLMMTGTTGR
jgi:hypothetical protein